MATALIQLSSSSPRSLARFSCIPFSRLAPIMGGESASPLPLSPWLSREEEEEWALIGEYRLTGFEGEWMEDLEAERDGFDPLMSTAGLSDVSIAALVSLVTTVTMVTGVVVMTGGASSAETVVPM